MNKEKEFLELWAENEKYLNYKALELENFNEDNAKDLMQDTLLKACSKFETWKPTFKFATWVLRIMKNTHIDKYRKVKDCQFDGLDSEAINLSEVLLDNKDKALDAEIHFEELMDHAERILSDNIKKPFKLWLDSYSYEEISKKLNQPVGTVKTNVFNARKKIKETFPKYFSN